MAFVFLFTKSLLFALSLSLQTIYFNPENLIEQLPAPLMIICVFKSYDPLWGSVKVTDKGKLVEDVLPDYFYCFLNDYSNTYLHPTNCPYSSIHLRFRQTQKNWGIKKWKLFINASNTHPQISLLLLNVVSFYDLFNMFCR